MNRYGDLRRRKGSDGYVGLCGQYNASASLPKAQPVESATSPHSAPTAPELLVAPSLRTPEVKELQGLRKHIREW